MVKTYNFREEIIEKLEKVQNDNILEVYIKLLRPLFMPRFKKLLNINTIYEKQTKMSESQDDEYSFKQDILEETRLIEERINRRNKAHIEVINTLFEFAAAHKEGFDFIEYLSSLDNNELKESMLEEKLIFMEMLKLYDLGEIDVTEWKKEEDETLFECNGEFDLAFCLKNVSYKEPEFYGIQKIILEKTEEKVQFDIVKEDNIEKIEMTNFKFIVN